MVARSCGELLRPWWWPGAVLVCFAHTCGGGECGGGSKL